MVELLEDLETEEWSLPTVCGEWDVKGVALHLLGGELANLSRRRDREPSAPGAGEDLVEWLNARNEEWVQAARFLSNPLLIELLDSAGESFEAYLATLDLDAREGHVSWADDAAVPVWLDVAREYTERWVHQQQIRDETGRPGMKDEELVGTALRTFVHALPMTYRDVDAPEGPAVELRVTGSGGGVWHVVRADGRWRLVAGSHAEPHAVVTLDEEDAWRLFTRNPHGREPRWHGDEALAGVMRGAVAIVA